MDGEREDRRIALEDDRGAVSVMHVQVDDRRAPDQPRVLNAANGNGDIVEQTEAFAMIGKRVM